MGPGQGSPPAARGALDRTWLAWADVLAGPAGIFGSAVAAGAAAYLVVRPPARLWPAFSDLTADYRTGTGEQRDIPLDGGMVRLNTQTAVNMHPAGAGAADAVDIELLSGEAMIALERGQALPVTVRAGGGTLRLASAARFNVRATGAMSASPVSRAGARWTQRAGPAPWSRDSR